jgi:hypothetical protein
VRASCNRGEFYRRLVTSRAGKLWLSAMGKTRAKRRGQGTRGTHSLSLSIYLSLSLSLSLSRSLSLSSLPIVVEAPLPPPPPGQHARTYGRLAAIICLTGSVAAASKSKYYWRRARASVRVARVALNSRGEISKHDCETGEETRAHVKQPRDRSSSTLSTRELIEPRSPPVFINTRGHRRSPGSSSRPVRIVWASLG